MRIRKDSEYLSDEQIEFIAKISDALAHPTRLYLFRYIMTCNLKRQNICNKDLVEYFDYAQATISQHMKKLVSSGLIEIKKDNRKTYYFAHFGTLQKYTKVTQEYFLSR